MEKVKKILGVSFTLFMFIILVGCSKEDEIVKIPNNEIPDLHFRDYLLKNFDHDLDGFISTGEAKLIKEININDNDNITSLQGIEFFTSLERLNISGLWRITDLDLSKNTELTVLNCSHISSLNEINLDLTQNIKLKELYCEGTYAKILNLSSNTELKVLNCSGNALETLDLKNNTKLEILDCSRNMLETLDLLKNNNLKVINISDNHLLYRKSFNLSDFRNLEEFYCNMDINDLSISSVPLRVLNVSHVINFNITNLSDLEMLSIKGFGGSNGSETLDLTKSAKLKYLNCDYINCKVNLSNCTVLEELYWGSTHEIDISKNKLLKTLYYSCDNDLDISNNTALETLHSLSFNTKILSFKNNTSLKNVLICMKDNENYDFSSNTLLENLFLKGFRDGEIFHSPIFDISNCKNLIDLTVYTCDIDKFDLKQCSKLKKVYIEDFLNLEMINAAGLQNLESFESKSYSTKSLEADFSNCVKLKNLYLTNKIKSLNLTGCTSLEGWDQYPR